MKNKPYFLALSKIDGIGPQKAMSLWSKWPSLADLFQLPKHALLEAGIPIKMAESIHTFHWNSIDIDLAWEREPDQHILTWEDPRYPPLLKEIYDPPIVIYAKGNLECLNAPCLAMVGTRKPSVSGKETAWQFAKILASHGITIVSGLALGIDAAAHAGCLAANGCTVAVMGTGIDYIYPYSHHALARKITEKGLLISEFTLKTTPNPGHFPRRNRIISGLTLATLITEAAIKSGSLITARFALEQNRDVLAMPGSIHNPQAKGCHQLLQQGATLITSVNDVFEALNLPQTKTSAEEKLQTLATEEIGLVKYIGFEITSIDQMLERSSMSIDVVATQLANLELQGLVKAVPGGYTRCISPAKQSEGNV